MHRGLAVVAIVALSGLVVLAVIVGCGGHSAQAPARPGAGVVTQGSFVGQAVCEGCHAGVAAEFANQVHGGVKYGGNFNNKYAQAGGIIQGFGGACQPCHVVGYGEPSGFDPGGSTPQLEGIGCEECHGPGGNHAAAPSSDNITKVGDAKETCYDCHAPSYKALDGIVAPITDADLAGKAPESVTIHHPQATYLEGVRGYQMPTMQSAHAQVQNQCIGCHLNPLPSSESLHAAGPSNKIDHSDDGLHPDTITCAPCHGGERGAVALFEHFEHEINETLITLVGEDPANPGHPIHSTGDFEGDVGAFAAAHGIDMADNSSPGDPNVKKLKGAIYLIQYFYHDASNGVHNPEFTEEMLDKAEDLVRLP